LLSKVRSVKWTNRYDCPPGYTFNADGWIETSVPFPKISVSFLPHLYTRIGEYQLLLQNLLALRLLNDHPHETLVRLLYNRATQAAFGRKPDATVFADVVQHSLAIRDYNQLPAFDRDILTMDTIWYSRDFTDTGKAAIKRKIRENYISDVRHLMPISKKYKTEEVRAEADITRYAMTAYWKSVGLSAKNRAISSIIEAVEEVGYDDMDMLAVTAGVSVRTIQRYKEMWKLKQHDTIQETN